MGSRWWEQVYHCWSGDLQVSKRRKLEWSMHSWIKGGDIKQELLSSWYRYRWLCIEIFMDVWFTHRLVYTHIFLCSIGWGGLEAITPQEQWANLVYRSCFLMLFSNLRNEGASKKSPILGLGKNKIQCEPENPVVSENKVLKTEQKQTKNTLHTGVKRKMFQ